MPEQLKSGARLKHGDVVMCLQELVDKDTGKPFTWRFYAVISDIRPRIGSIRAIRLGDENHRERLLHFLSPELKVYYMDPEEWPDGVHALRMAMILEGHLEI